MNKEDLKSNFYAFGNKGAVWSDSVHIAESGIHSGTTLCGTPMLSTNWAHLWDKKEIGCEECLKLYKETL